MIRKQHPTVTLAVQDTLDLTDHNKGWGQLRLEGIGPSRYVKDPVPPGSPSWHYARGRYEYDQYRVSGRAVPSEYEMSFGLKLYEDGHIRPSSVKGATTFPTREAASEFAEKWLAEGGPGLALEHPSVTRQRQLEAKSAYAYGKAVHWLSQISDADLLKLATTATEFITKRAEKEAKAAARAAEKQKKAAEKIRIAAEKAAAKAAKAEAKALKDAEKARKAAERDAKKALKVQAVIPAAPDAAA